MLSGRRGSRISRSEEEPGNAAAVPHIQLRTCEYFPRATAPGFITLEFLSPKCGVWPGSKCQMQRQKGPSLEIGLL